MKMKLNLKSIAALLAASVMTYLFASDNDRDN